MLSTRFPVAHAPEVSTLELLSVAAAGVVVGLSLATIAVAQFILWVQR